MFWWYRKYRKSWPSRGQWVQWGQDESEKVVEDLRTAALETFGREFLRCLGKCELNQRVYEVWSSASGCQAMKLEYLERKPVAMKRVSEHLKDRKWWERNELKHQKKKSSADEIKCLKEIASEISNVRSSFQC